MNSLVLCAWCERDGTRTVLGTIVGSAYPSHGICARHAADVRRELAVMAGRERGEA